MKIVERVLENRIRGLVMIDDMQLGFMPEKGTTHALLILTRMQEEFCWRKSCVCVLRTWKRPLIIPKKVMEWG